MVVVRIYYNDHGLAHSRAGYRKPKTVFIDKPLNGFSTARSFEADNKFLSFFQSYFH